jgi:hypothetical protein
MNWLHPLPPLPPAYVSKLSDLTTHRKTETERQKNFGQCIGSYLLHAIAQHTIRTYSDLSVRSVTFTEGTGQHCFSVNLHSIFYAKSPPMMILPHTSWVNFLSVEIRT